MLEGVVPPFPTYDSGLRVMVEGNAAGIIRFETEQIRLKLIRGGYSVLLTDFWFFNSKPLTIT